MSSALDYLNTNPDEFVQRYAPAAARSAASRRGNLAPALRGNTTATTLFDPPPERPLSAPVAQIHQPQ